MVLEGVDFSRTAGGFSPSVAALKAAGKSFVGRYAVNDKSPNGRGITAVEYQRYKDGGINVFLYWQTTTNWMLGGFEAGEQGARNAQFNIIEAGMPPNTPVYFACDFDASPGQQPDIDACLRGAASVLGFGRVGVYGSYHVVKRCAENGTANWFCQTYAWSGGLLYPFAHLYQYDNVGNWIDGTNVDLVRAFQDDFGQALPPAPPMPPPLPDPLPPQPGKITWDPAKDTGIVQYKGTDVLAMRTPVICTRAANLYVAATPKAAIVGKTVVGQEYVCVGSTDSGWLFLEIDEGYVPRAVRSAFRPFQPLPRDFLKHKGE